MIRYALGKSTALFPLKAARSIKPGDAYDYVGFCEVLKTSNSIEGLGSGGYEPEISRINLAPVDKVKDLVKIRLTEYYVIAGEWLADVKAFTPDTFEIVKVFNGPSSYEEIINSLI